MNNFQLIEIARQTYFGLTNDDKVANFDLPT